MLLIRNLISGLSLLDITLVGICEELNYNITGGNITYGKFNNTGFN